MVKGEWKRVNGKLRRVSEVAVNHNPPTDMIGLPARSVARIVDARWATLSLTEKVDLISAQVIAKEGAG